MQTVIIIVSVLIATASGQSVPGCPVRGCRPTGSFSFQARIPEDPKILWKRTLSEGETLNTDLGCVGNPYTLLCPVANETLKSYVSIDPVFGDTKWTEKNLVDPPLPLMDIYGRIIAFDGHKLTEILANGTVVPPVQKFEIDMAPTYSIVIADDSIFLLADSTGFLVTYDSDGVVHASIWLNRTDEGAYATIASPVIQGIRAYVLTQWKPFDPSKHREAKPSSEYRLWAIDIRPNTPPFMNTIWMFDFQSPSTNAPLGRHDEPVVIPRVMTQKTDSGSSNTVYVTLSHGGKTMWFIEDKGNTYSLRSTLSINIVAMSIDDNPTMKNQGNLKFSRNVQFDSLQKEETIEKHSSLLLRKLQTMQQKQDRYNSIDKEDKPNPVYENVHGFEKTGRNMWIVARYPSGGKHPETDELMMVDSQTGETLFNPMLMDLFNASIVRVTSEVMIVTPADPAVSDASPTVVLAVNVTANVSTPALNYVVAIQKSQEKAVLLWSIPVPDNFEVKGQITGMSSIQDARHYYVAYSHKQGSSGQLFAIVEAS